MQKFLVVGYDGHLVYEKKGKLKKVKCFISPRVRDVYKCMYVFIVCFAIRICTFACHSVSSFLIQQFQVREYSLFQLIPSRVFTCRVCHATQVSLNIPHLIITLLPPSHSQTPPHIVCSSSSIQSLISSHWMMEFRVLSP